MKFNTAINYTEGIHDYIHTDVWGPTKTASIRGNHYFVSFIDDYSRRRWIYTIKHKEKVLKLFVECKKNMEKNTERNIKVFHSDNGGDTLAILSDSYVAMRA